ncbi:MAG: GEVED domain-containing protein, partial [Saprospiraceae bacterium]
FADKSTTDATFPISAKESRTLSVQFTLVSGPATINGNTVTLTGQTGTVVIVANQGGNGQFNPAPPVTRSFSVNADNNNPDPPTGYCGSLGSAPWVEWIGNVTFGGIDNDSNKDRYGNFTNLLTTVNQGGSYPISVQPVFSWTQFDEYVRVWIDYNRDGDFDDANEVAFEQIYSADANGSTATPVSGNIQIPNAAGIGATRMRVSMQRGSYANPCENFAQGEVEDYLVNIIEGSGSSISINCPNNITVTAAQGATGRVVNWNAPTASTNCTNGTNVTIQQTAGLPSGSQFPIGTQTIEYTFSDECGSSRTCSFNVTVQPGQATTLTIDCPDDIVVTAAQGATSATVSWAAATATTDCNGTPTVQQTFGPASGSVFPLGSRTITYEAEDGCGNTEMCSFTVTVEENTNGGGGPLPTGYCEGRSVTPWFFWIGNVSFNTIDNDSDKRRTNDFTNLSTVVNRGASYELSLQTIYSWTHFDAYYRVWIDYNRDGDFDDTGEEVLSAVSAGGADGSTPPPVTANIQIPASADLGFARMRISMARAAYPADACTIVEQGEVEDYAIDIQNGNLQGGTIGRLGFENNPTESFSTEELHVYPNPTTDYVWLTAKGFEADNGTIQVVDINGKIVLQQRVRLDNNRPLQLALPDLPKGIYHLRLQTSDRNMASQRVVIQ